MLNTFTREEITSLGYGMSPDDVILVPSKSLNSVKTPTHRTKLTRRHSIKRPIISANMDTVTEHQMAVEMHRLGCFGPIHRFMTPAQQIAQVDEIKKRKCKLIGASIGIKPKERYRAKKLIQAGVNVIIVDIAHGHSDAMIRMISWLKDSFADIDVIAGNVATPDATHDLIMAGADAIKVGIGPGSMCTTRIKTGCGVPQLTAVAACSQIADQHRIPVIADGGIRESGDLTKLLAAGAQTVMIGSLFAGTYETPGEVRNGMKIYRGMASVEARSARNGKLGEWRAAEGVSKKIALKGNVSDTVIELCGGLSSGMSYLSARRISDLRNARFMRVTQAAIIESQPHGLK